MNNREKPLDLNFHSDLNLLTGTNGSSKTTVLKLIWFLNAGRILNLIKEINFVYAELTTSNSVLSIRRDIDNNSVTIGINKDKPFTISDLNLRELEYRRTTRIHEKLADIYNLSIPTIFFQHLEELKEDFQWEIILIQDSVDTKR